MEIVESFKSKVIKYYVELICFISVLTIAIYNLYNGFLHEDAYILFHYTENLSQHGIIAFDHTVGPAEGATDFLWMLLIGIIQIFKVDPGFTAALLNSLGAALLANAFLNISTNKNIWTRLTVFLLVVFGSYTAAAIGGFSALFYVGIYSQCLIVAIYGLVNRTIYLCLILALIRPDGVILSVGIILGLILTEKIKRGSYKHLAFAFLIGSIYFIWRLSYFGELLPLPLIIKSQSSTFLPGWYPNIKALYIFIPGLFIIAIWAKRFDWNKIVLLSLPAFILFLALLFAKQSQNIALRFQAPIIVSVLLIFWSFNKKIKLIAVLPFLIYGLRFDVLNTESLSSKQYIDSFPYYLQRSFKFDKDDHLAFSEAGRFAYFTKGKRMDLVGLNTLEIAKKGLNKDILKEYGPDLIFVHQASMYDIDIEPIEKFVMLNREEFFAKVSLKNIDALLPVGQAPYISYIYVKNVERFSRVFIVKYSGYNYNHVYFLTSSIDSKKFRLALTKSFSQPLRGHCSTSNLFPCNVGS